MTQTYVVWRTGARKAVAEHLTAPNARAAIGESQASALLKPATETGSPEAEAVSNRKKISYEKGNHSPVPGLRWHPRTCRPCGGRFAEGTGSRSGSRERQARRTHSPSGW